MREIFKHLTVVLHNVTSVHRVIEIVRLCIAFSCPNMVIIRPTGAAAQQGIPEAFKIAIKENLNISILSELKDLKEVLNISKIYFLTTSEGEELEKHIKDMVRELKNGEKIALVVHGQDLPFLPREIQLGIPIKIFNKLAPATSLLSIVLWELCKEST